MNELDLLTIRNPDLAADVAARLAAIHGGYEA
jgi:hypothetical protein